MHVRTTHSCGVDMPQRTVLSSSEREGLTEYKRLGFSDSDIAKISGHDDLEMVNAYDQSNRADNASKRVSLVN